MQIIKMSLRGMESGVSFRLIISSLVCLVMLTSIRYLYINNNLRKVFTTETHLIPAMYKLETDAYKDTQYNIKRSSPSAVTKDWITTMEEKYSQENERIRKICNKHRAKPLFDFKNNDEIRHVIVNEMWFDAKHRLAYCPNAKVASYQYLCWL